MMLKVVQAVCLGRRSQSHLSEFPRIIALACISSQNKAKKRWVSQARVLKARQRVSLC